MKKELYWEITFVDKNEKETIIKALTSQVLQITKVHQNKGLIVKQLKQII